jgi:putative aldouronate transport system permease protein
MENKLKPKLTIGKLVINCILLLFSLCCIMPIIAIASISLSDEIFLSKHGYSLFPKQINFDAYKFLLRSPGDILNAYKITILVVIIGVTLSLIIMSMLAYPLSRPDFKYRKGLAFFVFFTMLFNGGMVPLYIVVTRLLKLSDNFFALVVPYLVSAWNILLLRTFFQSIPISLIESAKIDGSGEFRTFFSIVIPLSKPALATIGVFMTLTYWNDWWLPLLYINNRKLYNLQYVLYKIMAYADDLINLMSKGIKIDYKTVPTESGRMALCMLTAGPMLFIFPFFQKYFVKGLTVGAVKG